MRRYSRIRALVLSLFSPDLYRDVAANWRGIGFLYLLLILTLTWIPVLYKWHVGANEFVQTEFPRLIQDFPPITITKGVVSSPVVQPYYVRDPESGKVWFILDTTGQVTQLPPGDDPIFLLTKTELIYRNQHKTETQKLATDLDFYVDRAKLQGWAEWWAGKGGYFLFPPVLIGNFIWRIITTLIYALIGLIFNSMYQKNLSFAALMRLAAVSTSAVIYINTIFYLTGYHLGFWTWALLGFALTCVYISLAVRWAEARVLPPSPYPPMQYPPGPYAGAPGSYPPPPSPYPPPAPPSPPPRI